tara:strand:- start:29681 stop:30712 length:1032 start_codon:yes stop_codon:yes gene_type:complete
MKHNLSIATALALSLLVVPACKKDKKEGADKTETSEKAGGDTKAKGGDKGTAEKGNSPGAAVAGDMMAHFPADTEIVMAFNIPSLIGSKMWKDYGDTAMAKVSKELGEFKETCGFDPITTIKTVHMGINSAKSEEPVMIVNGFAREQLTTCATAMAAKEGKQVEITEEGKFTIVSHEGKTTTIAWVDATTMLLVPKKDDKAYLEARMAGKDGLKGNAGFETAAGKANQSAPIWFAGNFAAGSPAGRGVGMGAAPKGFYGSLGFADGLDFNLGVTFADAKSAEETLNMAKPLLSIGKSKLGPAADIVDNLKLATNGADMTVGLKLTEADIAKLKTLAGPILGGM